MKTRRTIRHANPKWRLAYMRDVIAICREWGVPYCVWNYLSTPNDGNRFSLVDDDTRRLLIPVFADTDGFSSQDDSHRRVAVKAL